jgi:hypothetical protein
MSLRALAKQSRGTAPAVVVLLWIASQGLAMTKD